MAKLGPALVCSVAAHAGLLTVLAVPLHGDDTSLDVVEVAALLRQRPAEPRPEPPVAEPVPEPVPEPRRRPARRREPPRSAPPEAADEPATEAAPHPPAPPAFADPSPTASEEDLHAAATARAATHPSAAASSSPGRGSGGRGGAPRRQVSESGPDPCDAAARAVSTGLRSTDYPSWVRDLGLAGTVRVNLRVGRDGRPRGIRIASSSGHAALDRHTMSAVRGLRGLPGCTRQITVPVSYRVGRR